MLKEEFDNDTSDSDDEYFAFVGWISERAASNFREANGDLDKQKIALCQYLQVGLRANLTMSELIDFLAVDSQSILDEAGYTEKEGDDLMHIFDHLTEEDVNAFEPVKP